MNVWTDGMDGRIDRQIDRYGCFDSQYNWLSVKTSVTKAVIHDGNPFTFIITH